MRILLHVIREIMLLLSDGQTQAVADTLVAAVCKAAAAKRADCTLFPQTTASSVWSVLEVFQVEISYFTKIWFFKRFAMWQTCHVENRNKNESMAVDPCSFFADPDPAVFLNADPDPGGKMNADPCGSGSSLTYFVKNKLMKSFL